ncbi:MAG: ROK family glucokinase [Clostridiales Family XIII bacterium]|jgi:glucokinase|nr:ROK family glucokinase [Clostridiales Family XIII bacterium]
MFGKYSIGIDLGGTNIVAAVVDDTGKILVKTEAPTRAGRSYEAILADMANLAESAVKQSGIPFENIHSAGIGSPGSVNKSTGIVEFSSNLRWENKPLKKDLEQALNLPVYIENDANAATFGEYTVGAAKGYDTAIAVTLGTGVGGGMVQNGKIYAGANFAALEIGHMVIIKRGRPCLCGRRGCFERYASATGLITTTKEFMDAYPSSMLWEMTDGNPENLDGKIPFDAMKFGDEAAEKAVESFMDSLACGLTNLINILQPDIITIGGGLSNEGETLLAPVREKIASEVYTRNSKINTKIAKGALGAHAGVIGAANLYLEQ